MDKYRAPIAVLDGRWRLHTSDDPRSHVGDKFRFVQILHSVVQSITEYELSNGAQAFGLKDDICALFNTPAAVGEEAIA